MLIGSVLNVFNGILVTMACLFPVHLIRTLRFGIQTHCKYVYKHPTIKYVYAINNQCCHSFIVVIYLFIYSYPKIDSGT